jgi:pSer/pThr/pTyr-binding forkhead associated (FHA) protein
VIGRTDEAGVVVVESPRISGRHVRVTIRDGRVHIEDLGSRNGTALETGPIDPGVCVPIDTRQRFRIADAWLTLTEVR